jgi:chemotaxis protein methyltransferase CheR
MIWDGMIGPLHSIIAKRLGLAVGDVRGDALLAAAQELPRILRVESLDRVIQLLTELPLESPGWQHVISSLIIGETRFLRQPDWFGEITRLALVPLIAQRRLEGVHVLRCWSAGCSTGEEAYTLAMLLRDLLPDFSIWKIDILASDIHAGALAHAADAVYSARQFREVDEHHLARYVEKLHADQNKGQYQVVAELRNIVRFVSASLTEDAHRSPALQGGQFDVVICRNVLMYMTPDNQRAIARHLSHMLRPDGWLAVSPAEAMAEWFRELTPVNTANAILFQRMGKSVPRMQEAAPRQYQEPIEHELRRGREAIYQAPPRQSIQVQTTKAELPDIRLLADRGQLAEAKAHCLRLISDDALNSDANLLLAEICAEMGDISQAGEAARQAVYLIPSSPMAHFLLGNSFARQGRVGKARHAMQVALTLAQAAAADTPITPYSEITHRHLCVAASTFLQHLATKKLGDAPTHA